MRPHGRYRVSARNPQARAVCDNCGFQYNHVDLQWQHQWQGPRLQNQRVLACPRCIDIPNENLRTIIIPPDPVPIDNPRPEMGLLDDNPASSIGIPIGTLTGFGGLEAAFDASTNKPFNFCACAQINPVAPTPPAVNPALRFNVRSNSMYIPIIIGTV